MPAARKRSYSVGAVCRLTGLSPHVLRAWERRYGAVRPERTPGGTRRYSEEDIARLQLLASGVRAGHRIGDLAELADAEIDRLLETRTEPSAPQNEQVLEALGRLDPSEVERLLGMQLAALGPARFASDVAMPVLGEIGERWRTGRLCVASEHLGSVALRLFLGIAMRGQTNGGGIPIVFATPAGERHELGAMIAAVCAQSSGARAYYLGPDLPADQIVWAAHQTDARAVALGVVSLGRERLTEELRQVRAGLREDIELWVGGAGALKAQLPRGVRHLADLQTLNSQLRLLEARGTAA